jgi:hypothetical protein
VSNNTNNVLEQVIAQFEKFADPLVEALSYSGGVYDLLAIRGWNFTALKTADLSEFAALVEALQQSFMDLQAIQSFEDMSGVVKSIADLGQALEQLQSIRNTLVAAAGIQLTTEQAEALAGDILESLVFAYLRKNLPRSYEVLLVLTLIEIEYAQTLLDGAGTIVRYPIRRPALRFENLGKLLTDPLAHLKSEYMPGSGLLDDAATIAFATRLFGRLEAIVMALGGQAMAGLRDPLESELTNAANPDFPRSFTFAFSPPPVQLGGSGTALGSLLGSTLVVVPANGSASDRTPGPALEVVPFGLASFAVQLGSWTATLTSGGTSSPIVITEQSVRFSEPLASRFELGLDVSKGQEGSPALLLGSSSSTRLQIDKITFATSIQLAAGDREFGCLLDLHKATLIISAGEGDGFLSSVLPADGLAVEFDLGIGWSTTRGLYFAGSASLEADLPVHVGILGVLLIETIHLGLAAKNTDLVARVAADIELHLGPVKATVLGMGLRASLAPAPASVLGGGAPAGTKLGPLQALIGIQPPRGVSLVIDAEVVKGAGFILNDYERGRYAGGLSLSIADVVSVDALGLITTKLPDGSEGFSMLVILTATFPPIQLGFGFTLTGLGGLLGVHRTMDLPVLRDKVRTGVLDSILFPVNPLGRIVQVLNDVESVFPIARDRFTVGLMARLGWGSPQIIQADIGLILSLPMPISIALLGRVSAILPDPEAAIVELRIDVAGGLDLGRQELWIEAVLRDSRVAIFELSGGFALRSSWGPDPVFLLSVGGFNPHFTPPPDFRAPDRLAISLATSDNPRIRLESYLAITSNSLQIGARLDAFGSIEFLGVWSAQVYASFDALFTFEPFQFIVDLAGGVQICHDGKPFLGASFLLSLQGPEPLRAIGYVEVVFFGTHRIPLDITIGTGREQAAITAADPAKLLADAIKDQRNWSAVPPVLQQAVVTRDPEGAGLLVHPAGSLTFRQRVVPLEVRFELFGGQPVPGGWAQFTLTYSVGGPPPTNPALTKIRDAWAPADLFPLSDAERISQPSFTQLVSGHSGIGSTTAGTSGPGVTVNLNEFETSVIDADDWLPRRMSPQTGEPSISAAVLSGAHRASLTQSGDRWGARAESMAVTCLEPQYRVVAADSLTTQGNTLFDSWVEAGASAGGDPRLLVVPAHEARAR